MHLYLLYQNFFYVMLQRCNNIQAKALNNYRDNLILFINGYFSKKVTSIKWLYLEIFVDF